MTCSKCQNNYTVKNGQRHGKQCYRCKSCGFQFTGDNDFLVREKRAAITLCCFGMSARKVGLMLGYSHTTISTWVKIFENTRSTPSEDFFMDLDEMCEFLKERNNNPRFTRRFSSMEKALTWNIENEMSKIIEKVLSTLA